MKKGKIFTNCLLSVWTLCMAVAFVSCSSDSNDIIDNEIEPAISSVDAKDSFSMVLKAFSNGKDITVDGEVNNTTLFVFDENNDFYKQVNVDKTYLLEQKEIKFECPGSDYVTVIAWSGLSAENEEISTLNSSNIISDLQIRLKENNGVVSALPGDLFYGQAKIYSMNPATKANIQEVKIERKVTALNLTTTGIIKVYDSKEGNYFYKVKNTKSAFDHNGNLTGADVEYIIPASVNEKGELVSEKTSILAGSTIAIELYKDNKMIFSSENVKNAETLAATAGKQLNINFNLSRKSYEIVVTSWGSIVTNVIVG